MLDSIVNFFQGFFRSKKGFCSAPLVRVGFFPRHNIRFLLCIGIFFLTKGLFAQSPQIYSQYFINPYLYNPAMAGVEGHTAFFLIYRAQWVGIEGAPQVGQLSWHMPLRNGIGIGALVNNDQVGPLSNTFFKFTTSYLLNLDLTHFFRFGLSIGGGYNAIDRASLFTIGRFEETLSDDLSKYRDNSFYYHADFGMMYHFGRFNVGFSFPQLVGYSGVSENTFSAVRVSALDDIFFKMNYRQSLFNDNLAIEPHFLYRFNRHGSHQYEGSLIFHLNHLLWIGGSYRHEGGWIGFAGFKMANTIAIGYSFDLSGGDLANHSIGNHEVHLGFHLGGRKPHSEHEHSFIKSAAKTKEEKEAESDAAFEELLRGGGLPAGLPVADPVEDLGEDILDLSDSLPAIEEVLGEPLVPPVPPTPVADVDGEARARSLVGAMVIQGSNPMELPPGSYVITASFRVYNNAVRYSQYLLSRGYVSRVGYSSERNFYYVDVFKSNNVFDARVQRDKLRPSALFSDAWVLTVLGSLADQQEIFRSADPLKTLVEIQSRGSQQGGVSPPTEEEAVPEEGGAEEEGGLVPEEGGIEEEGLEAGGLESEEGVIEEEGLESEGLESEQGDIESDEGTEGGSGLE